MRTIEVKKRNLSFQHLIKTVPTEICGELIDEPALVLEGGKPVIGYFFLPNSLLAEVKEAARSVKLNKTFRTWGLPTQSCIFGVLPRHTTRHDYCRFSSQSRPQQKHFKSLLKALNFCAEMYEKHFPESYRAAKEEVQGSVPESWLYNDTPYLTVNVNVNHAIKYHRDSGNFKTALSTVLIAKENIRGGELCCPEFGVSLSQRNGALTLFEGQSILHGVMPISPTGPNPMRASVVFYSMEQLKHCYPYTEEWQRAQKVATERATGALSEERKLKLAFQGKSMIEKKIGLEGFEALVKRIKSKT